MQNQVLYNKRTGQPVQIIARARTKPIMQDVVCYQELEPPYEYYVMEKVDFFEAYTRSFEELPRKRQKYLEKKQDLPDKQPRISKGEVLTRTEEEEVEPVDEKMRKMLAFFDAPTYRQKLKILEEMKNDLDEHMINNMAVSILCKIMSTFSFCLISPHAPAISCENFLSAIYFSFLIETACIYFTVNAGSSKIVYKIVYCKQNKGSFERDLNPRPLHYE